MATETGPDGHHFVVLNISINNTPVFVSAVVVYRITPASRAACPSPSRGRGGYEKVFVVLLVFKGKAPVGEP